MALIDTYIQKVYDDMVSELEGCLKGSFCEKEKVEDSFWIAKNYCEKLKQLIIATEFDNEDAVINFFRNTKPLFTSQVEYFLILSEALFSAPPVKENAIDFWNEEKRRFERFKNRNKDFIDYYESGEHNKDRCYFLWADENWRPATPLPSYDADLRFCSTHDHLIRSYLAQKMYKEFVDKKIKDLMELKEPG